LSSTRAAGRDEDDGQLRHGLVDEPRERRADHEEYRIRVAQATVP
jgi:hypothetical protein